MSSKAKPDNVISLDGFRAKKTAAASPVSGDRNSLFVSHLDGLVKGTPNPLAPGETENFNDRIQRIRTSLEKINKLMAELKKQSREGHESK